MRIPRERWKVQGLGFYEVVDVFDGEDGLVWLGYLVSLRFGHLNASEAVWARLYLGSSDCSMEFLLLVRPWDVRVYRPMRPLGLRVLLLPGLQRTNHMDYIYSMLDQSAQPYVSWSNRIRDRHPYGVRSPDPKD